MAVPGIVKLGDASVQARWDVRVIEADDDLAPLEQQWDELACTAGTPFGAPAWMRSWWCHVAPADARLRVVSVLDGDRLVGIAPFFARTDRAGVTTYRVLGAGTSLRALPLARPGDEAGVARALVTALREASPRPDVLRFEGIPLASPWPDLLCRSWPSRRRPWAHQLLAMPAPFATPAPDEDAWLAARSRNFRQQVRRRRRQLEAGGATFALRTDPDEVAAALPAFAALHHGRWRHRGGSGVLTPAVEAMLTDVARRLAGTGRFRLWTIEVDGRIISAQVLVAAGGEVSYWLGGFDEAWAAQQTSLQALVAAVTHAGQAGDRRVDLGGGGQAYKYRLADGDEQLGWSVLLPPGDRYPLARARVAPEVVWRAGLRRVPSEAKDLVKRRLGRPVEGRRGAPPPAPRRPASTP